MRSQMWDVVLALAGNAVVLVVGWLVRGWFPRIPTRALFVAAVVLGLGVIPIAAFESWRATVFTAVGDVDTITVLLVALCVVYSLASELGYRRKLRWSRRTIEVLLTNQQQTHRELDETHRELEETQGELEETRRKLAKNDGPDSCTTWETPACCIRGPIHGRPPGIL